MSGSISTPPTSVSGFSGSERNFSRSQPLDSSSESDASISSDLQRETYTRYRYRVGAPALRPLPLACIEDNNAYQNAIFDEVRSRILEILQDIGVRFYQIELVLRAIPEDFATGQGDRTVYIRATWTGDECYQRWMRAVESIRQLFRSRADAATLFKVEIVSFELEAQRAMRAIEPGHRLIPEWSRLQQMVYFILQSSEPELAQAWIAIDPIRLGPVQYQTIELPVVISILVDWKCNPNHWDKPRKDIDEMMLSNGFPDVHTEFEHGDIILSGSFKLRPPTQYSDWQKDIILGPYKQKIDMGDDIGAARYFECTPNKTLVRGGFATLGGYLTIKKNGQQPRKVGVTNYHIIRPAIPGIAFRDDTGPKESVVEIPPKKETTLFETDMKGFGARYEPRRHMMLESPSRHKHNATMHNLDEAIQSFLLQSQHSDPPIREAAQARLLSAQNRQDEYREFFDEGKHLLGRVLNGSGMAERTSDNHRLDWALIEVSPERIGANIIPKLEQWPLKGDLTAATWCPSSAVCGKLLKEHVSLKKMVRKAGSGEFRDQKALSEAFRLCKSGARTGQTCGQFSLMKHNVRLTEFDERVKRGGSSEYCFVQMKAPQAWVDQPCGPFSDKGDSGAFCFTVDGRWAGQIWGGSTRQGVSPDCFLTYITDPGDLLDSIKGWLNKKEDGYTVELSAD